MSLCISSIFRHALVLIFVSLNFFLLSQNDSANYTVRVGDISISGNKITKKNIITRELPFNSGDTINIKYIGEVALRSQQNIFNTQLFIYDSVKYAVDANAGIVNFDIKVKERWYIIPAPIFEIQDRNFNQWWRTKDLFRINYGLALGWNNVTGHRDNLDLIIRRGYSEKYGIAYSFPYINKAQTVGLNFAYSYGRNNEVAYTTENNILFFYRDYKKYMREQHEAKIGVSIRNHLYQRSTVELLYNELHINDTIKKLNPDFFGDKRTKIGYFSLQYRYTYDKRDSKPYPLKGVTVEFGLVKDGLNFVYDESLNNLYTTLSLKKFTPLSSRFYIANQIKGRYINTDNMPYYFNRALGYNNDFIRGYEYYVIDGQSFALTKNSLKYKLIKQHIVEVKALNRRFSQFSTIPYSVYLTLNGDAGYVEDKFYGKKNSLNNSWQYGYGVGLDFVTYYDVVIRFEYTFNKQKQSGFFISMSAGI
jgi:outer membrane protein assembly factor BamA